MTHAHQIKKLLSTLRILRHLFMARTFGEYMHSTGSHDEADMAIYAWKGRLWAIPTTDIARDSL